MSAAVPSVSQRINGWAADTDEVAAILESTGINDRIARRDYGHPSVFTLAQQVLASVGRAGPLAAPARLRLPVSQAMVRAGLYLTPTVIAAGSAPLIGILPWYATTGLLVTGWGTAQALAYLGYNAANETGAATAARLLAIGFTGLAAIWTVLLVLAGASPLAYVVSAAQVMLFAANTATLVTATERRTLAVAAVSWAAVAALLLGGGQAAVVTLLLSIAAMMVVAYLPAWGPKASLRWRPGSRRLGVAVSHGIVGCGQAVLFILVVLKQNGTVAPALTSVPLLIGIPLTELMLLWHQQRVANGRARLADRGRFQRHVRVVAKGTGLILTLPLLVAVGLMLASRGPDGWALTASTLLAGINALCLVLVAHRHPGSAISLVWLAGVLLTIATFALPVLFADSAGVVSKTCTAILFLLYLPALLEATSAMKDPWSYQ